VLAHDLYNSRSSTLGNLPHNLYFAELCLVAESQTPLAHEVASSSSNSVLANGHAEPYRFAVVGTCVQCQRITFDN
jgi:hypothetical protein